MRLPLWNICQPAIAMQIYRKDHAIGNARFGGLHGALLRPAYQSSGLNKPPKAKTRTQRNIKPIRLCQLSRKLGVTMATSHYRIVRVGIRLLVARNVCD